MPANDFALLTRWTAERDPEAFRELASRYAAMVYATCHRVLGNATEEEDVAQECFMALAGKGGPAKSNLPAWLHKVATTRSIDHVKKDKRRKARERRFAEAQPSQVEPEWRDIQPLVDEEIAALREEYRVAVVAHFLDGQSHAEVADSLGVSRQTVTYRVGKGVEGIRHALKKKGVVISASALAAMFGVNLAEAAPAKLMAALGKMALSGGAGTAAAGAGASVLAGLTLASKVGLALGAAAIAVLALFVAHTAVHAPQQSRRRAQPPLSAHE
jgi:RNA polymerase sigma factor (sigma-70 family)